MLMISNIEHVWPVLHFLALGGLALYGMHRLWFLTCWYLQRRHCRRTKRTVAWTSTTPSVTVQLPLFNERFVAARLIDAAARLDWPRMRLEIQILDDSTDDTRDIVDERVAYWSENGVHIKVIRREGRGGFKAGALQEGLYKSNGNLIAIFDADFLPPVHFLRHAVPHFLDSTVGMVQARWGFLNGRHSWLTNLQSLLLGQHFRIEHQVRFMQGLFFNFNGTAGIWRREAIMSAGGWMSDTVTEDLDLSYRAQLVGWRFVYLDNLVVPSELPVTLSAFRSQQQRWAKGSIQTAKKILPRLIHSPSVPIRKKVEAAAHLLANLGWLLGSVIALTLYPAIISRVGIGPHQLLRFDVPLFLLGSGAILFYFYLYAATQSEGKPILRVLLLAVFTIGLAPSLAVAVLEGMISRGGIFRRTAKFGIHGRSPLPNLAYLYRQRPWFHILMNSALFAYSLQPVLFALERQTWMAIPFLIMFPAGFLFVVSWDLSELKGR